MKAEQERLGFVVKLAQTNDFDDIEKWRKPGKLSQKWREELERFFSPQKGRGRYGDIDIQPDLCDGARLPEAFTLEDFRDLQQKARAILEDVMHEWSKPVHLPEPFRLRKMDIMAVRIPKWKGRSIVHIHGPTPDMFILKTYLLLNQEPSDRILRCKSPAPGSTDRKQICGKIFYRVGPKKYCSTRCKVRNQMREYRKIEGVPEAERAAAFERYRKRNEERIRERYGRDVERRPRKPA